MNKIYMILFLFLITGESYCQTPSALNKTATEYFTQKQIDGMSPSYIEAMNYIVKYSWDIQKRVDKKFDTTVKFNRDTVDIRPFLKARKENQKVWINDVYPGLVIVLHSKAEIRERIKDIYNKK